MFTVNELLEIAVRSRDVLLFEKICDKLLAKEEKSIDICDTITAKQVAKNPSIYYGAKVTNYSANGVNDWKIFYSDGENIYLIKSDYIDVDKIPLTKGGNKLENKNSKYPKAATLINAVSDIAYSAGSGAIDSNNPARKWLASYLDNYSSTYNNMKAVAYMMDISVWNTFRTDKAEYAIGGPTLDMLLVSYNNKYKTEYQARAISDKGYQISEDGGVHWRNWYIVMLDKIDPLYGSIFENDALAYYLASPSFYDVEYVFTAFNNGLVCGNSHGNTYYGFRPIVCLKSSVSIITNDDGSVTLK